MRAMAVFSFGIESSGFNSTVSNFELQVGTGHFLRDKKQHRPANKNARFFAPKDGAQNDKIDAAMGTDIKDSFRSNLKPET